ncbi:MAG: non-homologous end joining protein Ku [Elusimicrobiota bacterium]
MRALWTGSIGFGLVNIPVRLYTAIEPQSLDLDMLHKKDLSPVRFARVCREDGREVPWEDIVKGYQVRKGDYIVLNEEDFKKADARKTGSIEILQFCREQEIETHYFEKPYYLEPEKGGQRAYALLREALRRSGKAGVAKFVLRNREHLAVLKPEDDVLVLNTLRFQSEIRAPDLNLPARAPAKGKELDMALKLIEQLTEPFRPEDYRDTYTDKLKKIIEEKSKGRTPAAKGEEPAPTRVPDLMAALRASLEREKEKV